MTKKEILKALARYPDDAEIGAIHIYDSFCDGVISTDFCIQSKTKIAKREVNDDFNAQNNFDKCRAFIVI